MNENPDNMTDPRTPPRIAIIGAGIAGCIAARRLSDRGFSVAVFEKSRGPGGRMSTRKVQFGDRLLTFDHGAQYFTARDDSFREFVASWERRQIVQPWHGRIVVLEDGKLTGESKSVQRYVACPGMTAMCKDLVTDLDVRCETHIERVVPDGDAFALCDVDGNRWGVFERVIVATPAEQAAGLLADFHRIAASIQPVVMQPCWAVMCAFEQPLELEWAGAFVNSGPLRWVAFDQSKPERDELTSRLICHADSDWTTQHFEASPQDVIETLLSAFWDATGQLPVTPFFQVAHRWRYAIPAEPLSLRCLTNDAGTLIACGDWAGGPRVEGAFLSGMAAADRVLETL